MLAAVEEETDAKKSRSNKTLIIGLILTVLVLVAAFEFRRTSTQDEQLPKKLELKDDDQVDADIFKGTNVTSKREFPFLVYIEFGLKDKKYTWCSGTILSKRYILTAAHCLTGKGQQAQNTRVIAGFFHGNQVGIKRFALRFFIHPSYNRHGLLHDIGIIKLVSGFKFSKSVQPIPLVNIEERGRSFSKKLYAVGWGLRGITRKPGNKVEDHKSMNLKYAVMKRVGCPRNQRKKRAICVKPRTGTTCGGDSGSPLLVKHRVGRGRKWVMLGVLSSGSNYCYMKDRNWKQHKSYYASVSVREHWKWIFSINAGRHHPKVLLRRKKCARRVKCQPWLRFWWMWDRCTRRKVRC